VPNARPKATAIANNRYVVIAISPLGRPIADSLLDNHSLENVAIYGIVIAGPGWGCEQP
jgi:hypothetical protein